MRTLSVKDFRDNLSDLLGSVYFGRESVTVQKHGKILAVLINPEEYARFQKQQRSEAFKIIDAIRALNVHVNSEEAWKIATDEVKTARLERYVKDRNS